MKHPLPSIFWVETLFAFVTALLALITLLRKDWIEQIFHVDPDLHSGSSEWQLIIGLCMVATLLAALALRNWRNAYQIDRDARASGGSQGGLDVL